ncbi:type II secretion system F family protein [Nocardioides litoris]|uniref:type II secretion system F family protein n=1 Tax=Nocardioides litoris TaxID=1926648 RepID=UPI001122C99D|nr:type II secretion system F family protein [Nocardioides litoris]
MGVAVAVLAAAGCAALLPASSGRMADARTGSAPALRVGLVAGAAVLVTGWVSRTPTVMALAAVLAVTALGGRRLWRAARARRTAAATADRVLETCAALAAELGSGRSAGAALDRVTADWPALAPVAEAHRVGADVPAAWRALATTPGAGDLRVVGAAWQVAHRTGEGLADTLRRVADGLRADAATRRVVSGELASARATARLVAALPLLALTMGNGAGGDPWGFLLGHPVGLACLAAGLGLGLAGLAWIEALAREVDR